MTEETGERAALSSRAGLFLDRASRFLKILRAVILVIATVLLVYAGWLAASSLYKIIGRRAP